MSESELIALLEERRVKVTANRLIVARALCQAGRPLSLMELEEEIGTMDKSSIFRSLSLFKENHLVHSIEDGGDGARYELCYSHDSTRDQDTHVHFYCEKCHRTFCLEGIPVPEVALPEGFKGLTSNHLVKGICPECSSEEKE